MNPITGEIVEMTGNQPLPEGFVEISPQVRKIVDAGHRALAAQRKRRRIAARKSRNRNRR